MTTAKVIINNNNHHQEVNSDLSSFLSLKTRHDILELLG